MFPNFSWKRSSLARDFFLLALAVCMTISVLAGVFIRKLYTEQYERDEHRMEKHAIRLEHVLADSLDYSAQQLRYMAQQIQQRQADPRYIQALLASFEKTRGDALRFNGVHWVDPSGHVKASSNPEWSEHANIQMEPAHRETVFSVAEKMVIGQPMEGAISKRWVIPVGFVPKLPESQKGALVAGIEVAQMMRMLERDREAEDISFAILDARGNLLAESADYQFILRSNNLLSTFDQLKTKAKEGINWSEEKDGWRLQSGLYQRSLQDYPYRILITTDRFQSEQNLKHMMVLRVWELGMVGAVTMIVLVLLYVRFVRPVMRLAESVEGISKGREAEVPRGGAYEIHVLAKQIAHTQRFIRRIRRLEKRWREATNTAEEASKAKSNFLAHMSHELRTPLNAILGYTEMMIKECFGALGHEKYREYAEHIHHSGGQLLRLVSNIVDIADAEQKQLHIQKTPVEILGLIEKAIGRLEEEAKHRHVTFRREIEISFILLGDPARLEEAFYQVIQNAVRFSPLKGGMVTIQTTQEFAQAIIRVVDQGVGMRQEELPSIRKPFAKMSNAWKRDANAHSLNIGLPLVDTVMQAHGGELRIQSEKAVGTTVSMCFKEGVMEMESKKLAV